MTWRDAQESPSDIARERPTRWLVMLGHVSPYMLGLWARLRDREGDDVRLLCVNEPRDESFSHESVALPEWCYPVASRWSLGRALRIATSFRPDICVCLGHMNGYALAVAASQRRATCVYMGDTNGEQLQADCESRLRRRLALFGKRLVLPRLFHYAMVLGKTNRLAAELHGFNQIVEMPLLTTDFDHWGGPPIPSVAVKSDPAAIRDDDPLQSPRLVVVARLVPVKNLVTLGRAWRRLVSSGVRGSLTVIGEGPERPAVEAATRGIPPSRFRMAGAAPQAAVGRTLAAADGLVLPSLRDAWAVVVTESLGLGVPVLATRTVGAASSLCEQAGGAVDLCGPTEEDLCDAIPTFLSHLAERKAAATRYASTIRHRFGEDEVASRLRHWGRDVRSTD
jgi:glycosyltransferase involved in cell wall biosynthesis